MSEDLEAIDGLCEKIIEQRDRIEALEAALRFYADPGTYHAIAILGDPPCGEFAKDSSKDEWTKECGYNRPMPGKRARAALDKDAGIGCGKSVIEPWSAALDKDAGK